MQQQQQSKKRKQLDPTDPSTFGRWHASEWRSVAPHINSKFPFLADARQLLFTPIAQDTVQKKRKLNDGQEVLEATPRTRTLGDMLAYNFLVFSRNDRKYALVRQYNREGEETQPMATQVELQQLTSQGEGLDVVQTRLVAPRVFETMLMEESRELKQFNGDVQATQLGTVENWMNALLTMEEEIDTLPSLRQTRIKNESELVKSLMIRVQKIVKKRSEYDAALAKEAQTAEKVREAIRNQLSDPKEIEAAEKAERKRAKQAKPVADAECEGKLLNPSPTPVHILKLFLNSAYVPVANGFRMFDPEMPLHRHQPLEDYAGWNIDPETGVVRFFVGPEKEHLMDDKTIRDLIKHNPDGVLTEAQWFLRQYYEVICGSNTALWWWEMAKIELTQRLPEWKSGKVSLSVGTFGIGKSLLLEIMIVLIIGYEGRVGMKFSSVERAGIGSERFGDHLQFCRAGTIEEFRTPKDRNAFKNAVTEVKQNRENKFEKGKTVNEFTNFWGSSNDIPWLEWNQRRLVLLTSRVTQDFDVSRVLALRKDRRVLALIRAITCGQVFELGLQHKVYAGDPIKKEGLAGLQWRSLDSFEYYWSVAVSEQLIKKSEKSRKYDRLMQERNKMVVASSNQFTDEQRLSIYDQHASQLTMIHPLTPLMAYAYVQQLHKTNAIGHCLLSEVFDRLRVNSIQFATNSSHSTSEFLNRIGIISGESLLSAAKELEEKPLPNYVLFEEPTKAGQMAKFVWPLRDKDYNSACIQEKIPYASDLSRARPDRPLPKTVNGKLCYPVPLSALGRMAAYKAKQRLKFNGEISEHANEQAHVADESSTLSLLESQPKTEKEREEYGRRVLNWLNKAFTYGRAETATTLEVFQTDDQWPIHWSFNDGSNDVPQLERYARIQQQAVVEPGIEKLQREHQEWLKKNDKANQAAERDAKKAELASNIEKLRSNFVWNPRIYSHWTEDVADSPYSETRDHDPQQEIRNARERRLTTHVVFLPAGLQVAMGYMQSFKSETQLLQFPVYGPEME